MKKNRIYILTAVAVLVLASLACNAVTGGGGDTTTSDENSNGGFSFTTANISNAHMSSDQNDSQTVTSYGTADPGFYCYFDLKNAPDSTVVKGVWTLISAEGYDPNQEIDSAEITGGDNTYYFSLDRSAEAWPIGQYKIDLYVDGNLVQTVNFDVK